MFSMFYTKLGIVGTDSSTRYSLLVFQIYFVFNVITFNWRIVAAFSRLKQKYWQRQKGEKAN